MPSFCFDRRFTDPSPPELDDAVSEAVAAANYRCRTRLVAAHWIDADAVFERPHGLQRDDGGCVGTAYKYPAESSRIAVGWWTDPDGRLLVRVVSDRVSCNGSVGPICGDVNSGWAFLHPEQAGQRVNLHIEFARRIVESFGPVEDPADDFRMRFARLLAARSPDGLILVDRFQQPRVVELVVRCPSTGQRHHIGVPTRFADPQTATFHRLQTDANRVHAAAAWTFGLRPSEYQPLVEA